MKDSLNLYLGKKYGKTCVYNFFSADHWAAMEEWRWNEKEQSKIATQAKRENQTESSEKLVNGSTKERPM